MVSSTINCIWQQQQQQQLRQYANDTRLDVNDDNLQFHSIEINDINSMSPNSRRSDKLMSISCHKKNNGCKRNSATKTKNRNKNKNKSLGTKNNKQIHHDIYNTNANDSITPSGTGVNPGGDGGVIKGGIGNGGQQVISCKILSKNVLIFIGFNPIITYIIIPVVGAFVARIFLIQKSPNWLRDVLSPSTNIYQFLSLLVVGLAIYILYAQRRNIFVFAIFNHFENSNKSGKIDKHSNDGQCVNNHSFN